jgi:hypothetical protein
VSKRPMQFWFETIGSELLINVIICLNLFRGGPGFHWDNLDIIAVINITDQDVRVAVAGSYRKFPRQVLMVKILMAERYYDLGRGC